MQPQRVLSRWQEQKYNEDPDYFFLRMQKKFRSKYPYSIYVLNKVLHYKFNTLEVCPENPACLHQVETQTEGAVQAIQIDN